jgi:hypothetical protein
MKRSLGRVAVQVLGLLMVRLALALGLDVRRSLKRWGIVVAQFLVLLLVNLAHAAGLGVTGDGFLNTFATWIPTLLFLAMLVGIAIWLQSSSDYGQGVLSGSVSLFSRGVIGGGALAILTALGFSQGAILT